MLQYLSRNVRQNIQISFIHRLANEKYKSKVELRTLNPRWLEQFDFHLFEDQSQLLDISVWDKDPKAKDEFIGRYEQNVISKFASQIILYESGIQKQSILFFPYCTIW